MPEDKKLKVTNIKSGESWMKTPEEIAALKRAFPGRFTYEKEVDTPKLADKIPARAKDKPAEEQA